eukprot:TRINITY_DN21954_c0_g1_i1.p1 TRINITY_DN21954_c0_g1~~TRINITY_DN21954_c0_g1_i1.p1  ORF type:complete len:359 (-),score=47.15 TRINITY_DN21954_c0_g1_i1:166-1242(-)
MANRITYSPREMYEFNTKRYPTLKIPAVLLRGTRGTYPNPSSFVPARRLSDVPLPLSAGSSPALGADKASANILPPWLALDTAGLSTPVLTEVPLDNPVAADPAVVLAAARDTQPPFDPAILAVSYSGRTPAERSAARALRASGDPAWPHFSALFPSRAPTEPVTTVPKFPGDKQGVIYQIATEFGSTPWHCPFWTGKVGVGAFPRLKRGSLSDIVAPQFDYQVSYTSDVPGAHIEVDLINFVCKPTHFAMAHQHCTGTTTDRPAVPYPRFFMRSWEVHASLNGQDWHLVSNHVDDYTLTLANPFAVFRMNKPKDEFYRYFRVVDPNRPAPCHAVTMCCFELYGEVKLALDPTVKAKY